MMIIETTVGPEFEGARAFYRRHGYRHDPGLLRGRPGQDRVSEEAGRPDVLRRLTSSPIAFAGELSIRAVNQIGRSPCDGALYPPRRGNGGRATLVRILAMGARAAVARSRPGPWTPRVIVMARAESGGHPFTGERRHHEPGGVSRGLSTPESPDVRPSRGARW